MRFFLILTIITAAVLTVSAQHEYAPVAEKEVNYRDWTYKTVGDASKSINLRDASAGKKLVLVVYFAPWCPNWRLQAPIVEKFYEKYKGSGLEIIAVGEYASVAEMKASIDQFKITFPVVYESDSQAARLTTEHYKYRQLTGDHRKWGSPWSIFLVPSKLKSKGETLTERAHTANGELIEAEAEAFIREKLGLPKESPKSNVSSAKSPEVCEPEIALKKPR